MKSKRLIIIGIEVIFLIAFYYFLNSRYIEILPQCWIFQETGLLCPACGGTRCVINMLHGNWVAAFFSHILFFIGILYLLVINVVYLINLGKEEKIATSVYPQYWYGIIFVILLIIYTIMRNLL